jgi:hypothetical protein
MREQIQILQQRVKDLEGRERRHSPSVTLFDPHAPSPYLSESSSSSSHDSPNAFSLSTSASPVPFSLGTSIPHFPTYPRVLTLMQTLNPHHGKSSGVV